MAHVIQKVLAGRHPPVSKGSYVPYHAGEHVRCVVRAIIESTPPGYQQPMSANDMIRLLLVNGMPESMATKLHSQIRKGATLHAEWKAAFDSGRFQQKLGHRFHNHERSLSQQNLASLTMPREISTFSHSCEVRDTGEVDLIFHQLYLSTL